MFCAKRTVLTAWSVAGGSWLIGGDGPAEWVDAAACRVAMPEEASRIAALGRELLLRHRPGSGALPPAEVAWLLAAPRRVACLVDLLVAFEEPAEVQSAPVSITLRATGEVAWRFRMAEAGHHGPVARERPYCWPMARAAAKSVSIPAAESATNGQ